MKETIEKDHFHHLDGASMDAWRYSTRRLRIRENESKRENGGSVSKSLFVLPSFK